MKILFINNEFPPIGGGGSILTSYMAKNLVKLGHQVVVVTSKFSTLPDKEKVDGYQVVRIPALRSSKDFSNYLELMTFFVSGIVNIPKIIKGFKPDLIQSFFSVPSGAISYMLSKKFNIPYAVYLGGSDVPGANPGRHKFIYPFVTPVIKKVLKESQMVTACSDMLIDLVKKELPDMKVLKIPNGVDSDYFVPPTEKPKNPPINILGVGRIMPRKGFQHLIEALSVLKKDERKKVRLTLIGSGDYRKTLEEIALKNKTSEIIDFVDSVPYSHLKDYYQRAHIFCLPSLAEGMPLAMIEAMACGCAILGTDVAGNQELIKDGVNGYLVKPGESEQLGKRLLDMVRDFKKTESMGKESRLLSKKYDWEILTKEYIKNYAKIIK